MAARTIDITAEERSVIWDMAEMAYSGALESVAHEAARGEVDHATAVDVRLWLDALDVLGRKRDSGEGCSVPPNFPFAYVIESAERQALAVVEDGSKTLALNLRANSAERIAKWFLPPAEGDSEAQYIVAYHAIKAVRERMEAAEPGLFSACSEVPREEAKS